MNAKLCIRMLCLIALLFIGQFAQAQNIEGLLPIDQAYKLTANVDTPGVVKLHWTIAPDYYLYRGQMRFTGGTGVNLGEAQLPDGKKYFDQYLGAVETYHDSVDASIPYTLDSGTNRIKLSVRYQGCHEVEPKICYPPHVVALDLQAPAGIAGGSAVGSAAPRAAASPANQQSSDAGVSAQGAANGAAGSGEMNWVTAVLLALAGGLVLNLMPCVLPVLSIKAVGMLESGEDASKARRHAIAYTLGVVCAFAAIGLSILALRSTGQVLGWGVQLQQPIVVAILICVMVAVGLSMSGVVQIGTSFGNFGEGLATRSGWVGDFFTGVLAVVVASPCVAPFMGSALAYAFVAPMFVALLVFVALGLGLALPMLLITYVPAIGRVLPHPGAWMDTLKKVLAFPMYLAAVWLVWVLAHQRGADAVGLVLTATVLLAMALWWFEHSRHRAVQVRSFAALLLLLALAPIYVLSHLPPETATATTSQESIPFSPAKLAELRAAGTPVFVDMTADWCITCKANEHAVLDTAEFHDLLKRTGAVYMVGDWTDVDPVIGNFLQQHHSPGVPLYVVFPKGEGAGKMLPTVLTMSIVRAALETASNRAESVSSTVAAVSASTSPVTQPEVGGAHAQTTAQKPMDELQSLFLAIDANPNSLPAHQALLKFEADHGAYSADGSSAMAKEISAAIDKQYVTWARSYPASPATQLAIGMRLYGREDPSAAGHISKYLDIDADSPEDHTEEHARAYTMLATLATFRDDEAAKAEYLHKASQLMPKSAEYALQYAMAAHSAGALADVERKFPDTQTAAWAFVHSDNLASSDTKRAEIYRKAISKYPIPTFNASSYAAAHLFDFYLVEDPANALKLAQQVKAAQAGHQYGNWDWTKLEKLAQTYVQIQGLLRDGKATSAVDLLGGLEISKYSPNVPLVGRLKAQVLSDAGRVDEAYKNLVQQQAVMPEDATHIELVRTGAKLHKSLQEVDLDVNAARSAKSRPAPPLDLKEYGTGQTVSLANLRGKVVFITFWYPGCGPCRAELPHLETVVKGFSRKDIVFLGVNTNRSQDIDVLPFVKNGKHLFTPLEGTDAVIGPSGYNITLNPWNILIDKQGNIVYNGFLVTNPQAEQLLHNRIKSLM